MPHKALEHLPGIGPDDARRLRARGVSNTNLLLHAAMLDIDRRRLSKKTGLSPERLLVLAHECAMLEISGMDRYLPVMRRLGITSLRDLAVQDAAQLHATVVEAVGYGRAPSLGDVQYWVSQARSIDMLELEKES